MCHKLVMKCSVGVGPGVKLFRLKMRGWDANVQSNMLEGEWRVGEGGGVEG